jgi:hypothetical protein
MFDTSKRYLLSLKINIVLPITYRLDASFAKNIETILGFFWIAKMPSANCRQLVDAKSPMRETYQKGFIFFAMSQ